jgi:hypothetical protein
MPINWSGVKLIDQAVIPPPCTMNLLLGKVRRQSYDLGFHVLTGRREKERREFWLHVAAES